MTSVIFFINTTENCEAIESAQRIELSKSPKVIELSETLGFSTIFTTNFLAYEWVRVERRTDGERQIPGSKAYNVRRD